MRVLKIECSDVGSYEKLTALAPAGLLVFTFFFACGFQALALEKHLNRATWFKPVAFYVCLTWLAQPKGSRLQQRCSRHIQSSDK